MNYEKLVKDLEQEKSKLDATLARIQSNATAEVKRIVSSKVLKAENIIEEMKLLKAQSDEKALFEARKMRNDLADLEYKLYEDERPVYEDLPSGKIQLNQEVVIKSLSAKGTIVQLPNKKGEVKVKTGAITTTVKLSDLAKPITLKETTKEKPKNNKKVSFSPSKPAQNFITPEIMVLGKTVMEAIEIVEPFFMSLVDSENKTVRVVHGKGTMALAKGLHAYFKTCPMVDSFRYGRYGEGDNGVTIVTLK